MAESDTILLTRQRELLEQLKHQSGPQDVFDWRTPGYTIPGRFAELVARYPDRPAVYDSERSYTYQDLDEAANRVANALLAKRGPESEVVSLMMSRGTEAVVAALGTMKAGKAYVGFDSVFPDSRSSAILTDAESRIIVCDAAHSAMATRLAGPERELLHFDDITAQTSAAPEVRITSDTLAVLTYSSGTTGQPKGIVHSHYTALAHVGLLAGLEGYGINDRVTTYSALSSGSNFLKMFAALSSGACVAYFDIRQYGIERLLDWIAETGVTRTGSRAILRQMYLLAGDRQLPAVRSVTLGGDTIYRRDVEECRRLFPNALVSVGIGMTEASRVTEWLIEGSVALEEEAIPVGFPAPGVRILILTDDGAEVEPGEIGEIAVQSPYLAKGYWRQPELTARRFLHNTVYGSTPLYLTGDIGWFGSDGMLRHLGRKDYQVKIRGYLVPTNDVEGVILSQPGISEAVVVKHTEGADRGTLLAYVVAENGSQQSADRLQSALAAKLPHYMVPQRIIFMVELPKNANGKIDRARLPAPDSVRPFLRTPYVVPSSPLEMRIAALWSELLGVAPVGLHDEFMALGGDSLRAMQLVNRISAEFDVDLPASALLSAPTVSEMVALLSEHLAAVVDRES